MASAEALIRQLISRVEAAEQQAARSNKLYEELVHACENQPRSISQEIDSIPGRRIFYTLSDRAAFTINDLGRSGQKLTYLISQDGPFIATHYPMAIWNPTSPNNATQLGKWSPVSSWPLPTQQNADTDTIDISYEVMDSGSQRNFQNEMLPPVFSRPDNLIPLPVPTLFAPNSVITITPFYEDIFFNPDNQVATTGGNLVIAIPGYRIVNM